MYSGDNQVDITIHVVIETDLLLRGYVMHVQFIGYSKYNLQIHIDTHTLWRFGAVGNDVDRINKVTLRRARLVLGWETVLGLNSRCGKFISV